MQKPIKTLIVEDLPDVALKLKRVLMDTQHGLFIESQITIVNTFEDAVSALTEMQYDLTLLDIKLGASLSYDILNEIDRGRLGSVVFTTEVDGIPPDQLEKFRPIHTLSKPYSNKGIRILLGMLLDYINDGIEMDTYAIPLFDGSIVVLPTKLIYAIEANNKYSKIHCIKSDNVYDILYNSNLSLKSFEENYSSKKFKRCQKSYLVNIDHIKRLIPDDKNSGGIIEFISKQSVTIRYNKEFKEAYLKGLA
jgi:two-component system LytT family response regulator